MQSQRIDARLHLNKILQEHGTVVVDQGFLSETFWHSLDALTTEANLPYCVSHQGDTAEKCTTHYFRVKKTGEDDIYHQEIMDLIVSPEVMDLYSNVTGLSDIEIDRAQAHIYKSPGFLAPHVDTDSVPSYLYTLVFILSDEYEGGEFVVKNKFTGRYDSFKPSKYSLILTRSDFQHEVREITKGLRRVFCAFIQPTEIATSS